MVKTFIDAVATSQFSRWWFAALAISVCVTAQDADAQSARTERVKLRLDPAVILQHVARQMNVTLRADEPVPKIFLESTTPLRQFQNAIAPQWKFRPHVFANAYAAERNEIYLSDDASYYKRRKRTLDDSLAHEFVHYIQVRYRKHDLADPTCEDEAIAVQLSFIDSQAPMVASVAG